MDIRSHPKEPPVPSPPQIVAPGVRFADIPGACHALSVSRSTLYELLSAGRIRSVHLGTRRLIPVSELDRFAKELTSQLD